MVRSFFQQLYCSTDGVEEEVKCQINFPQLSDRSLASLIRPVCPKEIETTLFGMEGNKAPGPDGVPASFYQRLGNYMRLGD